MRTILLALHIGGGLIGILSGAVAMVFRKGFRWHALAGQVFVAAMLTMAGSGATLAVMKQQTGNILGGTLTFYLVATAWMTAKKGEREKAGLFEWGALTMALVAGLAEMILGARVAMGMTEKAPGVPLAVYFVFGAIMLLAASGDIRWMLQGGAFGMKRLVRHLWRMCFAFFIATGSFFLGQQKVFPAAWRGSAIWWVLGFLPLALLVGWLGRVWFTKYGRTLGSGASLYVQRERQAVLESAGAGRKGRGYNHVVGTDRSAEIGRSTDSSAAAAS